MKKSENIMFLKIEYLRKGSSVLAETFREFQGQSNLFMDQTSAGYSFPLNQELLTIFCHGDLWGTLYFSEIRMLLKDLSNFANINRKEKNLSMI